MMHFQFERTEKAVRVLWCCPCEAVSTKRKIPFVQLQRGKMGNTDSDVHQCLV